MAAAAESATVVMLAAAETAVVAKSVAAVSASPVDAEPRFTPPEEHAEEHAEASLVTTGPRASAESAHV